MEKTKEQKIFDKVSQRIQNGLNYQVSKITKNIDECSDDVSDETVDKIANDILALATYHTGKIYIDTIFKQTQKKNDNTEWIILNINNAKTLINTIKITK